MNYKIVGGDSRIGQIVVRYFNDVGEGVADYAIDLPVVDGQYPDWEALETLIQERAPVWLLQRITELATADFSAVAALIETHAESPSNPVGVLTLQDKLDVLVEQLETVARGVEQRFITSYRQSTYLEKHRQAQAFATAGYNAPPPPYVGYEAKETGRTARLVADTIIAKHAQWHEVINPQIEGIRLGTKTSILAATTVEQAEALLAAALTRIRAL